MAKTYTIGEVAEMLGISRDMIRYYEKQGIIKSKRNEKNNYRVYDTMTVFWLMEAIQHKNLGINIADILSMRMHDFEKQSADYLKKRIAGLKASVRYQTVLTARLEVLQDRFALGTANIGRYWVTKVSAYYTTHFVDGQGDHYGTIDISKAASAIVFSNRFNPFFDNGFEAVGDTQIWQQVMAASDVEKLGQRETLLKTGDFSLRPETFALTTHVNLGEVDTFDGAVLDDFASHCQTLDYKRNKALPVSALLVSRGMQGGRFHRILELHYPILL